MCKLTLLNHMREEFKRKWVNQPKKKKSKLITYGNWSYNNNFSEERCVNYWTSVVLSKILCSCDYFCELQKSQIICTVILLLQCTPHIFICTFMCILALSSLKRESNSGTQLSLRVFRDCNFQVPWFSEASDALSLRLMERSPCKKNSAAISMHWCSFGIQGKVAANAELPPCPGEEMIWEECLNYAAGHWCWLYCCCSAN